MGQGQSSASDNADVEEPLAKADYYDLLGVERTATDDELKKAYRRKALELHPDRNYGNVENATRLFADIQTAYEVLSDPQERAWYDSHRDVLLRGDQNTGGGAGGGGGDEFSYNIRMTTTDDVLKLMLKFNGRLEYTDAPSGFYGGLHDFFRELAKEEDIARQWEGEESMDYPDFGSKDDQYDDIVRPFYAAWTGFATRKSYAWKDQYRLSDAPDRRIRRLMEKENKKVREDAIQEYNDAVRCLVAFVRKRDPRIQNNQKSEAERQKALREAAAAQAARSRAARQAQFEQSDTTAIPDWAQSRTRDEHEGGFSSESDSEQHEYECVVCAKTFKSEAQFQAHEKSKKHIKLAKQLRKEMRAEGVELDLDPERESQQQSNHVSQADDNENVELQQPDQTMSRSEVQNQPSDRDSTDDETQAPPVKGKINLPTTGLDSDDSDAEEDYAPRSAVLNRLTNYEVDSISARFDGTTLTGTPTETSTGTPILSDADGELTPRLGKAKQKRAKKAAQKPGGSTDTGVSTSELKCVVCQAEFPSKTKLFNHIKDKNHAAPIQQTKATKGGKAKKK